MTADNIQGSALDPRAWESRLHLKGSAALDRWDATGRAAFLALNPHLLS